MPVLITTIDLDVYKTLRDICDPILPHNKIYEELCEILKTHFSPRIAVFKERKKFYELKQSDLESVSQWYARIKRGAVNCDFGVESEGRLKDKLVTGMKDGKILDQVLEENHKLSCQEILEIALKKKASLVPSKSLESTDINKIMAGRESQNRRAASAGDGKQASSGSRPRQDVSASKQNVTCRHCGSTNHNFYKCKYKTYKCDSCGEVGHLKKICKNKIKNKHENHYVEENIEEKDDDVDENNYVSLYNMNKKEKNLIIPAIKIKVKVEKIEILMEVDSGAGLSVMPYDLYLKYFSHIEIQKCSRVLRAYNNNVILPLGEIDVKIQFKSCLVNSKIIVIDQKNKLPLLGRDLMVKLGLYIHVIISLQIQEQKLDVLIKKYSQLFDGKLVKYSGSKIHLKFI